MLTSGLIRAVARWLNFLPLWGSFRVRVWGSLLRAPNFDRLLCLWLHRAGWMGRTEHAFLLTQLRPGMTVVDIGANQGLYTLFFSKQAGPGGRVIAFEPDDILYAALARNIAYNHAENVQLRGLALGSVNSTMTLHRSLLNSGDNRLATEGSGSSFREPLQIQVARLDQILAGQRIDFIKMDVQGWEMQVFLGMEQLLDDPRNKALAIYFEYWPRGLLDAGSHPHEPLTFLSNRQFQIFRIVEGKIQLISNLPAFVHLAEPRAYINLYAVRG